MTLYYFAYGSNMSPHRLRERVPAIEAISVARLAGYALCWHKPGRDGSAKCDIVCAGDSEVYGVVYRIARADKPLLDRYEGLGVGYNAGEVELECRDGGRITAFTYMAAITERGLKPFSWYKHHTLFGARSFALPPAYVDQICAVPAVTDPDSERHERELSIYSADELAGLG